MKRYVLWLILAASVLFNIFFLAGYVAAREEAKQVTAQQAVPERVASALNLNEEQAALYRQLRDSLGSEVSAVDNELAVVEYELLEAMRQTDVERVRELMDREAELRHQRIRMASDRFGRFLEALSPKQRKEFCGKVGRRHSGRMRWERQLLERFDADDDGKLNAEERRRARDYMEQKWAERNQKYLIDRFDANGDGKLEGEESERAASYMQQRRAERRPRDPLNQFDADNDGKLDAGEWEAVRQAVRNLDQNGDDELDAEEWRAFRSLMGVRSGDRSDRSGRGGPSSRRGSHDADRADGDRQRRPF